MVMKREVEILIKYAQADFFRRIYLFLQFPNLRDAFQEIECMDLAAQMTSAYSTEQHSKDKCFRTGCPGDPGVPLPS
jgi:hypothetical protein